MTTATRTRHTRLFAALAAALAIGVIVIALVAGGGRGHPGEIHAGDLAEAQTFPFYRVYWVGPRFDGNALAAVDGLKSYISSFGEGIYYGDCVQKKGIFGGGSCSLPLQVNTVIYHVHSNKALGPQYNLLVRGVPAVVYDEGRSIEVYTGRVAIDVFSDTPAHALAAVLRLAPVNAPGSSSGLLAAPIYCPGLAGPEEPSVERVMQTLPERACQRAAATTAFTRAVRGE